MNFPGALVRKSLADVTRRKRSTTLIILGIMIGILGLTAVNLADDIMGSAFAFSYDISNLPDLALNTQSQSIDASLLAGVQRMANVAQAHLRTEYDTTWHINGGSGSAHLSIMGNASNSPDALGTFQLTGGRLPESGEIVMESSDSSVQPFSIGDTITIDTKSGPTTLRFVGLARTPGNIYQQDGLAYMRPDALQRLAHLNGPNDLLLKLRIANQQTLQQATTEIVQYLHQHGIQRVGASGQIDSSSNQIIVSSVFNVIRVVSLIALLLACLLLINSMNTLIIEQIPIIGTMKAIGGQRRTIIRGYLISVSIYSIAGTLLGIMLGVIAGTLLAENFATSLALNLGPFTLSTRVLLLSLGAGLILPQLAAFVPLAYGTNITVRQAITAYGVQNTGRQLGFGSHNQTLWWVPQTAWLGLRGVFRKRARATLTLVALTLSTAVFLAVQTTTASIGVTLDTLAHTYNSDITVSVDARPYQPLHTLLSQVPNLEIIEPKMVQTVQLPQIVRGQLDLVGLLENTRIYQPHLIAGRWLTKNETNAMVLSDIAAGSLGLHVGNELTFTSNQHPQHWRVVGIVHDLNKDLGKTIGVAYAGIQAVNSLNHAPSDLISTLLVRAHDRSPAAVDKLAKNLYTALAQKGIAAQVTTLQQQIQQNQGPAQIVYAIFDLVAVIVALVGVLELFGTLSSSVLERHLEIGILRSLGASSRRVAIVFLAEGLTLAILAWLIGLVIGIPGAYGLIAMLNQQLIPLDFLFNPLLPLATLPLILLIVVLASSGPVLSASRLRIRDLLRYE